MIPPWIPLGKTPVLHLRLAFGQAGRPPDPVLTPDCANGVVSVGTPRKSLQGRSGRACPARVSEDRQRAGQSHRRVAEHNSREPVPTAGPGWHMR